MVPGTLCWLAVLVLVLWPGRVSAHTDVDFTLPTDGASVGQPVAEITVGFTEPVTLVGNGFEVLDPQGNVIVPFAVTDDDQVFRLQLDPPLGGGTVGVAYEVTSLDGHVVTGTFTFTVSVPAPTTAPPTTAPPATTAPPSTSAAPSTTARPTTPDTTAAPTDPTTAPSTTAPSTTPASTTADVGDESDDTASDDGSDSTWIILLGAGAVAIGAGAFLLFRRKPAA